MKGRELDCLGGVKSWDRLVAECRMGGVGVGDLMRRAKVTEGGRCHRWNRETLTSEALWKSEPPLRLRLRSAF